MIPHHPLHTFLTNALPVVLLYLSNSSWLTGSGVYPIPGCCSLASELSHWRRAPVASLVAFWLQSTRSKWFHSYRAVIILNRLPSPAHFAALLPLANSWISIAVFVDVAITYVAKLLRQRIYLYVRSRLSLFYYLRKSKTGFKSKHLPIIRRAAI